MSTASATPSTENASASNPSCAADLDWVSSSKWTFLVRPKLLNMSCWSAKSLSASSLNSLRVQSSASTARGDSSLLCATARASASAAACSKLWGDATNEQLDCPPGYV